MIFLPNEVLQKKNKTLRVSIKGKSCNSPEGLQLH